MPYSHPRHWCCARSSSRNRRLRTLPSPVMPRSQPRPPVRPGRAGRAVQCNVRGRWAARSATLGLSRPFQVAIWGVPGQLAAGRPRFFARVGSASLSNIFICMHRSHRTRTRSSPRAFAPRRLVRPSHAPRSRRAHADRLPRSSSTRLALRASVILHPRLRCASRLPPAPPATPRSAPLVAPRALHVPWRPLPSPRVRAALLASRRLRTLPRRSLLLRLSNLIHGYASRPDCGRLVNTFHLTLAALRCRAWLEWVPSKANISDLLCSCRAMMTAPSSTPSPRPTSTVCSRASTRSHSTCRPSHHGAPRSLTLHR